MTSLASTDQTEPAAPSKKCPYGRPRLVLELHTGQLYPDRCRSSRCPVCLPLNARRRCLAITLARPTRMIRLSLVADADTEDPCATALTRIKLIRRNLKRMGRHPGEWTFTIERNPKETGFHAHCLQRGSYIPQADLQDACEKAGAGLPYINAIEREGQWTSRYGLKGFGADGYGLKSFRPNADSREALRINHFRLEHHSRGFFAIDGTPIGVRDMEREAIAALNGQQRIAYVSVTQQRANLIMDNPPLRHALIRDIHQRQAGKLRCMT